MEDNTLFELVNPPFVLKFAGKEYTVRKANLEKAILYQAKVKELADAKEPSIDLKLAAYCLYLILRDIDDTITEDFIVKNSPADIDAVKWIQTLGFMTPQKKAEALKKEEGQ